MRKPVLHQHRYDSLVEEAAQCIAMTHLLKRLPSAVKVRVLAKDPTRLTAASIPKGPACSDREEAPGGKAAVTTSSAAETRMRRKYPVMKGA